MATSKLQRLCGTGLPTLGIATRFVSSALRLSFVPLETERFNLIVRTADLDLPLVRALTDALSVLSLRRKLADLAGYDTTKTGDRLC